MLSKIADTNVMIEYAKAQEELGNYSEALAGYEHAKKWKKLLRLM